jgi:hypothetical protein
MNVINQVIVRLLNVSKRFPRWRLIVLQAEKLKGKRQKETWGKMAYYSSLERRHSIGKKEK